VVRSKIVTEKDRKFKVHREWGNTRTLKSGGGGKVQAARSKSHWDQGNESDLDFNVIYGEGVRSTGKGDENSLLGLEKV